MVRTTNASPPLAMVANLALTWSVYRFNSSLSRTAGLPCLIVRTPKLPKFTRSVKFSSGGSQIDFNASSSSIDRPSLRIMKRAIKRNFSLMLTSTLPNCSFSAFHKVAWEILAEVVSFSQPVAISFQIANSINFQTH